MLWNVQTFELSNLLFIKLACLGKFIIVVLNGLVYNVGENFRLDAFYYLLV